MLRLGLPMLVALVEALAAIGTARGILRLARRGSSATSWLDRSLSAHFLVGLPLYGTLLFLAGLISTSAIAVCAITIPLAVFGVVEWATSRGERTARLRMRDPFGALALAAAGAISFLFAQLPSFTLDELAYHLAVPMQWVISGRVQEFPLISHSYFPFGLESADLFALRLLGHDGAVASHFVRLFCGVALAVLLARRLAVESTMPLLLTAAIVTTPALLVIVGWSWNDVPLIGIAVVLYLALEQFVLDTRALPLAGLAITAGLFTKYTFAPVALVVLAAAFALIDRAGRAALVRTAAIGGAAGALYFARNAVLTGNPIEPMITEGTGDIGYRWAGGLLETVGAYVFHVRFIDEALGLSLLVLAILAIARAPSRFSWWAALALLVTCACIAFLTPSVRVFLPFLVVPGLVGAQVVSRLSAGPRRAAAVALAIFVSAQLIGSALYLAFYRPLSLLTGETTAANWVVRRPLTGDVLWINANLPADSRSLIIGTQELFWFDREVRGGGNNDGPRVAAYLRADDAQQLRERLRRDGITHVVLNRGLVSGLSPDIKRRERETVLDPTTMETLVALLQQQRIVAANDPILIFELQ